jgi:hypothetical protein
MSDYALAPLAKADIFDIWSSIAAVAKMPLIASNRRFTMLAPFVPKDICAAIHARTSPRAPALLDTDPISQLHRCLPAGNNSAPGCRRASRQTKPTPHSDSAAVPTPRPEIAMCGAGSGCALRWKGVRDRNLPPRSWNSKLENWFLTAFRRYRSQFFRSTCCPQSRSSFFHRPRR